VALRSVFAAGKELGRGGLVFKAHRLVYHLTLGVKVIKKKKKKELGCACASARGFRGHEERESLLNL